jgi:hypothetical protein
LNQITNIFIFTKILVNKILKIALRVVTPSSSSKLGGGLLLIGQFSDRFLGFDVALKLVDHLF